MSVSRFEVGESPGVWLGWSLFLFEENSSSEPTLAPSGGFKPTTIVDSAKQEHFADIPSRLEAATLRLEDIATSTIELPKAVPGLTEGVASPEPSGSVPATTTVAAPAVPKAPAEPLPESIEEFDSFIATSVGKYVGLSKKIGGLVAEQAELVLQGFKEERRFLLITTKAKKPDISGSEMTVYQGMLNPINEAIMGVTNIKEANRGSPVFSQLSAVADGIMVLAWITVDNRPFKHVEEFLGSAQFFGNRVLKDAKDKDPQGVEWVQAFYQVFRDLQDYVKQYFTSGIPWNAKGESAQAVSKALDSGGAAAAPPPPPPPGAGGPPPPPPPPPPGPPPVLKIKEEKKAAAAAAPAGGFNDVFSELNKGVSVTAGLRKVDKSEMTHKNPSLRASSTVPEDGASSRAKSPAPGKKPKPESMRVKKPPKKALEGQKWIVVCDRYSSFSNLRSGEHCTNSRVNLNRKTSKRSLRPSRSTPSCRTRYLSAGAATRRCG